MRVIAGTAKGMKLKAPRGNAIRPTSDRVKEALFSIIAPRLAGSIFLDLYAGSGAIGIEALSRGAAGCIFADNRKEALNVVKENLAKTGLAEKARLVFSDAEKAVRLLAEEKVKADLIYLDPPYAATNISGVVNAVYSSGLMAENGLFIIEHACSNRQWAEGFNILKQRKYGNTCLTIISGHIR